MPIKHFDVARDRELVAAGTHFWCDTCLVACPNSEASPRAGRCLSCYGSLHREAAITPSPVKPTWDIITPDQSTVPAQAQVTTGKRGPRHHALPEELIRQLATEKKSSRKIADEVRLRTKTTVSYRTVQRILSGQRKEIANVS